MVTKHYVFWYALLFVIGLVSALVSIGLGSRVDASTIVIAVVVAAVFPAVAIWVLQRLGYPIGQQVHCSRCGTAMPLFRKPASTRQALFGGYRCTNCGADLDARGRELTPAAP